MRVARRLGGLGDSLVRGAAKAAAQQAEKIGEALATAKDAGDLIEISSRAECAVRCCAG